MGSKQYGVQTFCLISVESYNQLQMASLTDARSVVSCQLETRFTLTGEGAGNIDTAMLAVSVPALINV